MKRKGRCLFVAYRVDLPFFSKGGRKLFADDQCGDNAWDGAQADEEEEVCITQPIAHVSCNHTGQAHACRHQSGGKGIVCRLVGALGEVDEVEHVGSEAYAIAELLDCYECAHYPQVGALCPGQYDVEQVGHIDGQCHG